MVSMQWVLWVGMNQTNLEAVLNALKSRGKQGKHSGGAACTDVSGTVGVAFSK